MNIKVVCVGNIKEKFYVDAINEYKKRLSAFCNLNIIELKEHNINNPSLSEREIIKEKEGLEIKKHLGKFNILLNITGNELTSEKLADFIKEKAVNGNSELTFIIGGSYGVSNEIKNLVNFNLSFSKLTFPHQLFRVILLEQIYRAFTILNNKSYHK